MATSISQKLKIKSGSSLLTLNAPDGFKKELKDLPDNVKIIEKGTGYDQVHWFVLNRAQLEKELSKVMKLLREDVTVWIYYPKGTSKLQTDLTRDKGWDCLLSESDKLTWISLISFNDTWSVFGFRPKTASDQKKEDAKKPREIFEWVDPVKRTVKLPADLENSLKKNKKQLEFFTNLSFTNKKEYIEWIITAKREETRKERIAGTMERLGKAWKNPRNV